MKCYKETLWKNSKVLYLKFIDTRIYHQWTKYTDVCLWCMFMSKYEKGKKSLDFCMLPSSQENWNFHIRRANYVATIFNSANMWQMDLVSSLEHGWDENLATLRSDLAFPENISNVLFEVTMRVQTTRAQRNTFQIQVIKKKVRSNIFKEFYIKVFDLHNS